MYLNNIRQYSSIMLMMSISLMIVGMTNIFPYSVEIVGVSTSDLMDGVAEDWTNIQGLVEAGNPLEYAIAAGLLAWECVKIVIAVVLFVFGGFGSVLAIFGIPTGICVLLQLIVDFMVLFELAQTFFIKS